MINEAVLQFIWKYRLFKQSNLFTEQGDTVDILNTGELNEDAGPDFFNARIKIGSTVWAGNIEIHINENDWFSHKHNSDKAYESVILHVVYNSSGKVKNEKPLLCLKNHISKSLLDKYSLLMNSEKWIPCSGQIKEVDSIYSKIWLERLAIERMNRKSEEIINEAKRLNNDWNQVCFNYLAYSYGLKINSNPMQLLAQSVPYNYILKYASSSLQVNSLLFGMAGFLDQQVKDEYPNLLKSEFSFLSKKHKLSPSINIGMWKFLRLRPVSFPTIKIAQLCALIIKHPEIFSKIISLKNSKDARLLFSEVEIDSYWNTHYRFDRSSSFLIKKMGSSTISTVLINAVVPLIYAYGLIKNEPAYKDTALSILEETEAEQNKIIRNWKTEGIFVENALDSQGLIELKNNYCSHKKCLSCSFLNKILVKK